ncbi:hypothetical protein GX50_05891 [[Emmonsia] crescens]|uniref:Uncharacterized protein n=1 Tax=[Emmonsia] crescens TaxID=73230 RepID=A0A2B7ZEB9_9EURO|nr:hypothetical protein GX50_05891 [Emmonsia crescens]
MQSDKISLAGEKSAELISGNTNDTMNTQDEKTGGREPTRYTPHPTLSLKRAGRRTLHGETSLLLLLDLLQEELFLRRSTVQRKHDTESFLSLTGADISTRDVGDFDRYTFMGLKAEFGEQKRNAMNCIWASFGAVLGFAVMVDRAVFFRGHLAERLDASSWHVPGINKREEMPQQEDQLSALLSAEVRHVVIWDGNDDDDDETSSLSKRHIAKGTENNRHRLRSRRTHKYNNQYFGKGGLDFIARTDPYNDNNRGIYINADDPKEFNWLAQQVACYLSSWDPIRGLSPMSSHGFNFQIYNSWDGQRWQQGLSRHSPKIKGRSLESLRVASTQLANVSVKV